MKYYCPYCLTNTEHSLEYIEKEYEFGENKVTILAKSIFCDRCSNENFDQRLHDENKHVAYEAYHKLMPYID